MNHLLISTTVPSVAVVTATAVGTTAQHGLVSAITGIRGGAAAATVVDMTRAALRMDSLDEYAMVASIVLGAVINCYGSCPKKGLMKREEQFAKVVHITSTMVSFLCGLYVITTFTLFNTYARTALGTGADQVYLQLYEATGGIRLQSFRAFLMCLVAFEFALVANIFLTLKGRCRWVYSSLCAMGTAFCLKEWLFIVACATKHIFI
jgi:hypothetical protein